MTTCGWLQLLFNRKTEKKLGPPPPHPPGFGFPTIPPFTRNFLFFLGGASTETKRYMQNSRCAKLCKDATNHTTSVESEKNPTTKHATRHGGTRLLYHGPVAQTLSAQRDNSRTSFVYFWKAEHEGRANYGLRQTPQPSPTPTAGPRPRGKIATAHRLTQDATISACCAHRVNFSVTFPTRNPTGRPTDRGDHGTARTGHSNN